MLLKGLKRILMLFLIPIWIPIVIIYFLYIWLIRFPVDFVSYHIYGFRLFGSFSAYRKPDSRVNFLVYAQVRKFNHEYITDIDGGFIIDCFWVKTTADRNYAFITEKSKRTKTDYENIIFIYDKYFKEELGVILDGVYLVTGSKRKLPLSNCKIIETREIKKFLERGKV